MPPVSGFNIGKEASLDLIHPDLGPVPLGLLTHFESKPQVSTLKSTPITNGGKSINRAVYTGWEGSFEFDRSNGLIDTLVQYLEDRYYAGGGESYFMITETISNPDGSIDEFRYNSVVVTPQEMGSWKAEDKVTIKLNFVATNREKA